MKTAQIRKAFIDFFASKNHQVISSSSLIPGNDPSLLFTNAGMVQFKDTFLGIEPRNYSRAVSAQRCVRAGGKHNDLENVGYTARHHTFFEMLGNFSFGDYFKKEAIQYAWTFLTKILQISPEKLWITVYLDDDEAANIWLHEIGIPQDRLSRCGEKDNFWSMGDTGPCGPCTEIFYDHGPEIPGGPPGTAEAEGDRYIEIWNLVFMQYNRDNQGQLHPLPKPSVDTGMGLERIAAVVQGVHNNYDIDSFQTLIQAIIKLKEGLDFQSPSVRVIADHIRAASFLIVDGVHPSNEGRGYVLRRIIRRALRHGHKLGITYPFFSDLVEPLCQIMADAYPELQREKTEIQRLLKQEENLFSKTLDQGMNLLKAEIETLKSDEIPGEVLFKLYDTYGFPVDLTADIAKEQGLTVDFAGFERCMEQQRQLSQAANQFNVDYSRLEEIKETSHFHGYELEQLESEVTAILVEGKKVEELASKSRAGIILTQTPFYAESGGQVGDQGELTTDGMLFKVEDTQKMGQAIIHYGELVVGKVQPGQKVFAIVNSKRRDAIRLNHTATHLLHAALKQIVGSHVQQKGSLVDAERARFDFSHFEPISPKQLAAIEQLVNAQIRANNPVQTELMALEEAKKSGAVALFNEKYSESVRVLSIGDFSKELCGGTHVSRTGDIGLFKITAEYGIASGIRRIEMATGHYALTWLNERLVKLDEMAQRLKTSPEKLSEKLSQILHDLKQKEKDLNQLHHKLVTQSGDELLTKAETLAGIDFLIHQLPTGDSQSLRATLDQLKARLQNAVIILYVLDQGKINVVAGLSKNLVGQVPAARTLVQELCGRGGGRDDMAQGGGDIPSDLKERIARIKKLIAERAV